MSNENSFSWWNILLWIGWAFWGFLLFYVGKEVGFIQMWINVAQNKGYMFFVISAIWLWGTTRWIVLKLKKEKQEQVKLSFLRILLVNIVAPVIVSIILFELTDNDSLTLISVPILGLISANLNIG